ncbi:DUF4139 domain-containing protein [Thiolapillus sp.]|uniref:DUF4139 domain-containing protein n=1 Tax=Thiolapillus sp. TaxID=2017437 RepID=UPI0025D54460|nr:hypothetical protein [Thiolapillus sp.]
MISLRPIIPFLLACASASAASTELVSELQGQTGLAVTIYNSDLALIKDRRRISLPSGITDLAIRGVSAQMRPETALLRNISHPGKLQVREQNFNFDLLTPAKMLEKYVGQTVEIIRMNPATGQETREAAKILSTNSGVVAEIGGRIETNPEGRYIFPAIPANLRDKPTLVTQVISKTSGSQELELSYLSRGLGWKADYVVELNSSDNALDLAGWVTLTNESGTSYPQARLQLVAGDVNQVRENMSYRKRTPRMEMAMDAVPAPMAEEALFERIPSVYPGSPDNHCQQADQAGFPAQRQQGACYQGTGFPGPGLLLPQRIHLSRRIPQSSRLYPVPEQGRQRHGHATAKRYCAGVQTGQQGQRTIRGRRPHRTYTQERTDTAQAGRSFRCHRNEETDQLQKGQLRTPTLPAMESEAKTGSPQ